MKKFILALIILTSYNLFATNWYVSNASKGSNNGTSWANAWSPSTINWTSVQPGDFVYLDGGTDSLVYTTGIDVGKSGTFAARITITVGANSPFLSGHNGKVIFEGNGGSLRAFNIQATGAGRNYITIEGRSGGVNLIECRNLSQGVNLEDVTNYCIISGLNIYNYTGQGAIMQNGASLYTVDSTVVRYCRIISIQMAASQSDGIYSQRAGNYLFHDNYIRQRNQDPAAHTDCIQSYLTQGAVLYNNTCINDSVYSVEGGGTPMIFGIQGSARKNLVVNNFLYMGGIWYPTGNQNSAWWSRGYTAPYDGTDLAFVNNTVVVNGPRCRAGIQEYRTTSHNNIFAIFSTTSSGVMANLEKGGGVSYIWVDSTKNNLFYKSTGSASFSGTFMGHSGNTGTPSATTWFSTFGGTGIMNQNPNFVNHFGYEPDQGALTPELQSNSPAIDRGNDVFNIADYIKWRNDLGFDGVNPHTGEWRAPENTDILGNPRDSNPDLGAFEFQSGATDTVPSFAFTPVTNATLTTEYLGTATFSGADSTFHVWTTTGAQFRINAGTYSTAMKTAVSGDSVGVKNTSSGSYLTLTRQTIVAGGLSRNFDVTTIASPIDTIPDAFSTPNVSDAHLNTLYTTPPITLTGYNQTYLYCGGQQFRIDGGLWATGRASISSGSYFEVRRTSSSNYSTTISTSITAGGTNYNWTITTEVSPTFVMPIARLSNGNILIDASGKIVRVHP
jgi:hypothetical protein